jgi:YidC/Oxa1 family membrane protein insertase
LAEFHNPQQEPGTERRLLLVFAVTFLIILAFQPLLKKYLPQPPAKTEQPAVETHTSQPSAAETVSPAIVPPAGTRQASTEAETVIENDLYKIRFSNRGAQVKSWILKKFTDDNDRPLELVSPLASEHYGYPLSLWSYDETLRNKLNTALYVSTAGQNSLSAPADITFEYSDPEIAVRKTFRFDHTYVVKVETSVVQKGAVVSAFPMWPAGFGDETTPAAFAASRIEYQNNGAIERLAIKKVSGGGTVQGPFQWAGVTDQYFAAVFVPDEPQNVALVTLNNPLDVPKDWKKPDPKETVRVEVLGAAVGNLHGPTVARLFVGPKALDVLEAVAVPTISSEHQDLRSLVDFGWLGLIARPLFLWLKWTYNHIVPNWGWAIVVQTLIINLALMPLRIAQMKSMLKMQRIAPQVKSIQEKYKKYSMRDPRKQEMNQEVSALYKEHGVNPAGGCLPLLVQMPFLFAYYRMLGVALDLRHANWLWIKDLSSPDPLHIMPIAIIVTMLFMQRMTPQAGMDPAQQKMMNVFMPIMLGFISWSLAAGLCLYWSEGNLIAIVQQWIMNRTELGREMREMAEKRARKKDK